MLEEQLEARGREIQRRLLQDHLDLRAARERRRGLVTGPDGVARTRAEAGHTRGNGRERSRRLGVEELQKSSGARAPRIRDWLKQEASFTMSVPSAWPLMRTFTPVVGNRVELYAMLRPPSGLITTFH